MCCCIFLTIRRHRLYSPQLSITEGSIQEEIITNNELWQE